jgi:ATP-binding cassette subfamily F protein 3
LITFYQTGFEFSGRWLYRNVNWQIRPGKRIGLIGRNGTGKSTLLKLINGDLFPSEGKLEKSRNLKIGYLHQDLLTLESGNTILEIALSAFEEEMALLKRAEELEHEEFPDPMEIAETHERLFALDAYNLEPKAHIILAGLGFKNEDRNQPFDTFSGGWRMRALLARILLSNPGVLLLDEPTNHLDLPSIQWLENYLSNFAGATIIVSHDRFFLDRMAEEIAEVEHSRLNTYSGNYSYYEKEKVLREEQLQKEYDNQQREIKETERFIERFKAKASKATQAQSRVTKLERMERIEAPMKKSAAMNLRFSPAVTPGVNILEIKNLYKDYDGKVVLESANASIRRGDKIALVGANGIGKSTLLKMMAHTIPYQGEITTGHNVMVSFFAQHQLEILRPELNLLEELDNECRKFTETRVRTLLGSFLFSGEDVLKKIKVLSGGERSRLALAKTLMAQGNFLLLDEPTNHLDLISIEILAEALHGYEGTFITVSHDRHFLRMVANKIWYIEDKTLKEYPGDYAEFEGWQKERAAAGSGQDKKQDKSAKVNTPAPVENKVDKNRKKSLENKIAEIEGHITLLENLKLQHMEEMASPSTSRNFQKLNELELEIKKIEKELKPLNDEWTRLYEELSNLS